MTETKPPISRVASCSCHAVQVELVGDPQIVGAFNCTQCQRRTGSVFGVAVYFDKSPIRSIEGETRAFNRSSDSGRPLSLHFCIICGTTVYWDLQMLPQSIGVAVGCFADPGFPAPERTVWCATKHAWVMFPEKTAHFPGC